jgi:hypothetical protein
MSSAVSSNSSADPGIVEVERCTTFNDTGSPEIVGDGEETEEAGAGLGEVREQPTKAKAKIVMAIASDLVRFTAAKESI